MRARLYWPAVGLSTCDQPSVLPVTLLLTKSCEFYFRMARWTNWVRSVLVAEWKYEGCILYRLLAKAPLMLSRKVGCEGKSINAQLGVLIPSIWENGFVFKAERDMENNYDKSGLSSCFFSPFIYFFLKLLLFMLCCCVILDLCEVGSSARAHCGRLRLDGFCVADIA